MATNETDAAPTPSFGWTILHVADVGAAVAFYERAFGLRCRFADPAGEYAELDTGATALAFAAHGLISRLTGEPAAEASPSGCEIALTLPPESVGAAYERAVAAGAVAVRPPAIMPWGQTVGFVRDPFGVLVEICTPPPG